MPRTNYNGHQHLINSDPINDYQFYTEDSVLGAALHRLMSPTTPSTVNHSVEEARTTTNDGVSIVSAPKNVKFLVPLGRSGLASNESTFGVIESTTRTITHVKDIFPLNSSTQSQTVVTINNEDQGVTSSASETAVNQNEIINNNELEEQPLLPNNES